jgi:WD40 repeat protein
LSVKEFEIVTFYDVLNGHKGEIRCLCYETIKGAKYLITGSTDRSIKIWENDPKAKSTV